MPPLATKSLQRLRSFSVAAWLLVLLSIALAYAVGSTAGTWPEAISVAEAAGKKPRLDAIVQVWAWRGLAIDLGLMLALAVSLQWWLGRGRGHPILTETSLPRGNALWLWRTALVSTVVLAVFMRWPRMDLGFYNDEAHNFMRMTAGIWKDGPPGEIPVYRAATWTETLWSNTNGNNSQPHSLLSRISYQAWLWLSGKPAGAVSETAVRIPALLAGLFGLTLLGAAVRRMAGTPAAVFTLLAAALHGWHIRYSTEARGYSLMLLGVCGGWWFLERALKTGSWRHWLGYGACSFLVVWAFPGAVYFLVVQSGLLLLRQLWLWKRRTLNFHQVLRPVLVGGFAVMLALPLMLPLVPQLVEAVGRNTSMQGAMQAPWWQDLGGFLLIGARWLDHDVANPLNLSPARWLATNPAWGWAYGFTAVTVLLGVGTLLRRGGAATMLAITGPAALLLAWASMNAKGNYLHHWYALYALPSVLAALGAGIAAWPVVLRIRSWQAGTTVTVVAAAGALLVPAYTGWQWRHLPRQDERAAVLTVRGSVWPFEEKLTPTSPLFAAVWCNTRLYDPTMAKLEDDGPLDELVERARRENRDLYVNVSHRPMARAGMPLSLQRLEQSGDFEKIQTFYGQEEEQFTQYLYRLRR